MSDEIGKIEVAVSSNRGDMRTESLSEPKLARLLEVPSRESWSLEARQMLSAWAEVLGAPKYRSDVGFVSLREWLRELDGSWRAHGDSEAHSASGSGLVAHFGPSNMPLTVAISVVGAVIAGCPSVVKLSSKDSLQSTLIEQSLNELRVMNSWAAESLLPCRFSSDDSRSGTIMSENARVRAIWGSDSSVAEIRRLPTHARCRDITFPARRSAVAIEANAVVREPDLGPLAREFFSDTMTGGQGACSSPSVIAWIGSHRSVAEAREKFWSRLEDLYVRRKWRDFGSAAERLAAVASRVDGRVPEPLVPVAGFRNFLPDIANGFVNDLFSDVRGGVFAECGFEDLVEAVQNFDNSFQTLTVWGFDARDLSEIQSRSIPFDRVKPVGKALDFELVWDGIDLVQAMSQVVVIDRSLTETPEDI